MKRLLAVFRPRELRVDSSSWCVVFAEVKVTLLYISSEYFCLPLQFTYYQLLHTKLLIAAHTLRPLVAGVPNGLSSGSCDI
jgi:hypothetical protein